MNTNNDMCDDMCNDMCDKSVAALLDSIDAGDLPKTLDVLRSAFVMSTSAWSKIMNSGRYAAIAALIILRGSITEIYDENRHENDTRMYSALFRVETSCDEHRKLAKWLVTSGEYDPDIGDLIALLQAGHLEFAREINDLRKLQYGYDEHAIPKYDKEEYDASLLDFCVANIQVVTMSTMKLLVEELSMKLDKDALDVLAQRSVRLNQDQLDAVTWAMNASAAQ